MNAHKHYTYLPVAVCAIIIGATAAAKAFALWQGNALLSQAHPWLPGTFLTWAVVGLIAEVAALAILAIGKQRLFLIASLVLGSLFISYHWYQVWQNVPSPCPCLGGMMGNGMAEIETRVSFALAITIALAAFFGLCQRGSLMEQSKPVRGNWIAIGAAILVWAVASAAFVIAYHGRDADSDESMEAAKALLVMEHPEQQPEMWNDQPPLLTHVFATLFHWFWPSLTVTRTFVAILGLLIPTTWILFLKPHQLTWAVAPAVAFLWALIPEMIGSAQLEPAAYAVATASAIPLIAMRNWKLAFVLSVLIGILSLNIKLTAAFGLVLPFVIIFMRSPVRAIGWGALVVAGVVASSMAQPNWSWAAMSESHLVAAGQARVFVFNTQQIALAWVPILFAIASFCYRYATRRLAPLFPLYMSLFVAIGIHLGHRPYWGYYSIHFLAPLCLLAGIGVVDVVAMLSRQTRMRAALVGASVCVLLVSWSIERLNNWGGKYTASTDISDSAPLIAAMKKYATTDRLGFSNDNIIAFASGLMPPPWVTIAPSKRVWSGNLTRIALIDTLVSNKVPVLAIPLDRERAWDRLLTNYSLVEIDKAVGVYVSKDLVPEGIVIKNASPLKQFGL